MAKTIIVAGPIQGVAPLLAPAEVNEVALDVPPNVLLLQKNLALVPHPGRLLTATASSTLKIALQAQTLAVAALVAAALVEAMAAASEMASEPSPVV